MNLPKVISEEGIDFYGISFRQLESIINAVSKLGTDNHTEAAKVLVKAGHQLLSKIGVDFDFEVSLVFGDGRFIIRRPDYSGHQVKYRMFSV